MLPVKCIRCFFFFFEFFSGKFAEIWAKILRTPKTLPAPTPMFSYVYIRKSDFLFTNVFCVVTVVINTQVVSTFFVLPISK